MKSFHLKRGGHSHSHGKLGVVRRVAAGAGGWLLSVVGLDLYTRGKAGEGLKRANAALNPFDHGILANCKDFWSKGADLAIDYPTLYDLPAEISPATAIRCRLSPTRSALVRPLAQLGYAPLRTSIDETDDEDRQGAWSMWSSIRSQRPLLPTTHTNE